MALLFIWGNPGGSIAISFHNLQQQFKVSQKSFESAIAPSEIVCNLAPDLYANSPAYELFFDKQPYSNRSIRVAGV